MAGHDRPESGLTERRASATIDFAGARKLANSAALRKYAAIAAIVVIVGGLAILVRRRLMRRSRRLETATEDQGST